MPPISGLPPRGRAPPSRPEGPRLQQSAVSPEIARAAAALARGAGGAEVTFVRYKANPAQLAELSRDRNAWNEFLYKTAMSPTTLGNRTWGEHNVQSYAPHDLDRQLFDLSVAPGEPLTAELRALEPQTRDAAKVLAAELRKAGSETFLASWGDSTIRAV